MYHEVTDAQIKRQRRRRIIVAVVIVVLIACLAVIARTAAKNARVNGAATLRESILSSAEQCCSVEGVYPSSLSYLESNYGLTVNHDDYVITYESFASNIMPSVVVIPR